MFSIVNYQLLNRLGIFDIMNSYKEPTTTKLMTQDYHTHMPTYKNSFGIGINTNSLIIEKETDIFFLWFFKYDEFTKKSSNQTYICFRVVKKSIELLVFQTMLNNLIISYSYFFDYNKSLTLYYHKVLNYFLNQLLLNKYILSS